MVWGRSTAGGSTLAKGSVNAGIGNGNATDDEHDSEFGDATQSHGKQHGKYSCGKGSHGKQHGKYSGDTQSHDTQYGAPHGTSYGKYSYDKWAHHTKASKYVSAKWSRDSRSVASAYENELASSGDDDIGVCDDAVYDVDIASSPYGIGLVTETSTRSVPYSQQPVPVARPSTSASVSSLDARPKSPPHRLQSTPKASPPPIVPIPSASPVIAPWRQPRTHDDTVHGVSGTDDAGDIAHDNIGQWGNDLWYETDNTDDNGHWADTTWYETGDAPTDIGQWNDDTLDNTGDTDNKWVDDSWNQYDGSQWAYDTCADTSMRDIGQPTYEKQKKQPSPPTFPPTQLQLKGKGKSNAATKVPAGALWQAVRVVKQMGHTIENLNYANACGVPDTAVRDASFHQTKLHSKRVAQLWRDANFQELESFLQSRDGGTLSAHLIAWGKGSHSRAA